MNVNMNMTSKNNNNKRKKNDLLTIQYTMNMNTLISNETV